MKASQRRLCVSAFLAGVFDAGDAFRGLGLVGRAAFAAGGEDAGVALFHHDGVARQGFAHQAVGLVAHRLLVHAGAPRFNNPAGFYSRNAV